jgi:hypothetical protein
MAEEELSIQVAEIDCVEIHNVDFPKTTDDKILEKFAPDAASTDH